MLAQQGQDGGKRGSYGFERMRFETDADAMGAVICVAADKVSPRYAPAAYGRAVSGFLAWCRRTGRDMVFWLLRE